MANTLSQTEFDALHAEHLRWYRMRGGSGPMDLYGRSLRGLDLRGRDLGGAELGGVDLAECDLTGTGFVRAALAGANLRGARLVDAVSTRRILTAPTSRAPTSAARGCCAQSVPRRSWSEPFSTTAISRRPSCGAPTYAEPVCVTRGWTPPVFAETLVEDTTFAGSTGTVGVGGTVILGANGKPVEAVAALTTAGARVTEHRPKRRG